MLILYLLGAIAGFTCSAIYYVRADPFKLSHRDEIVCASIFMGAIWPFVVIYWLADIVVQLMKKTL